MENNNSVKDNGRESKMQIIRHPMYQVPTKMSLSWFDLRVFYVRISNFLVDELTPESLTLNHIPLNPDTLLEVNGVRCAIDSEGISSTLRRDRVDKKSEEATFVSTDSIKFTGSVKFEVFDKEELVLFGVLEMPVSNGFNGELKNNRKWNMNCESVMAANGGFLKGKQISRSESLLPIFEVYVAGCFSGTPIILSKSLQLGYRKKKNRKGMLDSIPEYDSDSALEYESQQENETTENQSNGDPEIDLQLARFRNFKPENEEDYDSMYWRRTDYLDGEDGEMSWFNAGVRVGVGIGLGVCLGVGIGVGILVRSYTATTRTFRRRLG